MEAIKEYLVYGFLGAISAFLTYLVIPIGLGWLTLVAFLAAIAGYAIGNSVREARRVQWILIALAVAVVAVIVYALALAYGTPGAAVTILLAFCILLVFLPAGMILRLSRLLRK